MISAVGHETDFTIADFVSDLRAATPTAAAEAAVPDMRELRADMESFLLESVRAVKQKTAYLETSLEMYSPEKLVSAIENKINGYQNKLDSIMKDMVMLFKEKIHSEEIRIEKLKGRVDSLDPVKILSQGYGAVTDEEGKYIKSVSEIAPGDEINVIIKDGRISCIVKDIRKGEVQNNGKKKEF